MGIPFLIPKNAERRNREGMTDSQLQQRQIRVAVICAVLALLCDIVLEYGRRFGIVSVEAIEDGFDVFGPVRSVIKGYAHGCGWSYRIG